MLKASAALTIVLVLSILSIIGSGTFYFLTLEESRHQSNVADLNQDQSGLYIDPGEDFRYELFQIRSGTVTKVTDESESAQTDRLQFVLPQVIVNVDNAELNGGKFFYLESSHDVFPEIVLRECPQSGECLTFQDYFVSPDQDKLDQLVPNFSLIFADEIRIGDTFIMHEKIVADSQQSLEDLRTGQAEVERTIFIDR